MFADPAMTIPMPVAQSFTPARSGRLERVEIQAINFLAEPLAVEVSIVAVQNNGLPPTYDLIDSLRLAVAFASLPSTTVGSWTSIEFDTPAMVTANQQYAVVLRLVPFKDPAVTCAAHGYSDLVMCNYSFGNWTGSIDFTNSPSGHYAGGEAMRSWCGRPAPGSVEVDGWETWDPRYFDSTLRTFVRAVSCE